MPTINHVQSSFNAGEISPRVVGRTDLEKYRSGMKTCKNWVVLPHGGVTTRMGFKFVNECKHDNKICNLIPFEFSESVAYIIEAGDLYFRFYYLGGIIVKTAGDTDLWLTATAYSAYDYVKDGSDNIYRCILAHTSSASDEPGVGGSWQTYWVQDDTYEIASPYTEAQLDYIRWAQSNDVLFLAHGSHEVQKLERYGHNNWQLNPLNAINGPFMPKNETNITLDPAATTGTGIAVVASDDFFDATHVGALFKMADGIFEITGVTDAQNATCDILNNLTSHAATTEWWEGSFSDYRGWPSVITFFEDRLVLAATPSRPIDLYFSQTADYDNFGVSTPLVATDAVTYILNSHAQNTIRWLSPGKKLFIGTVGGEFWLQGSSSSEPISATDTPTSRQESPYGSSQMVPVEVDDAVLFVQRFSKKVREWVYNFESDSYRGTDVTILAEHLTFENFLFAMVHQQAPNQIIWMIRDDGTLIGFTYMREHKVFAWHEHTTGLDGEFEAAAVIPGTNEDELWVVTSRIVDGVVKRFVERMMPFFVDTTSDDAFMVDCGLTYDGAPTNAISGLGHLENEEVTILADGAVHPNQTVSSGSISLNYSASKVHVGIGHNCDIEFLNLNPDLGPTRSILGKNKKIVDVTLKLFRTLGLQIGRNLEELDVIPFRDSSIPLGTVDLFTGDKFVEVEHDYELETTLALRQSQPLPATLLAATFTLDVED